MSKTRAAYTTTLKQPTEINDLTATPVSGDKWAQDVNVKGGTSLALDGVNRDYVSLNEPDAVTEVYTYRLGGALGTITEVVTVVYTNAAKGTLNYASIVVL